MDWWSEVRQATELFLDKHGLFAAFVFLLVEEAGVPIPIPGDFLMLVLGVQARQGQVGLFEAIVVMQAATMLGATILYVVARMAGRGVVYRYGRFIRLSPERLDRAEQWLNKHGTRAVFLGRLLPGLRIVTAVACGVFSISPWIYLPAMSLGALVYIVAYTMLGYLVGPPVLSFLERLHLPLGLLGSLLPLAVIAVWLYRARRDIAFSLPTPASPRRQDCLRAGALAGGLATIASTLLINVVLNLAGNLAFQAPGSIIEQTAWRMSRALARETEPWLLFVAAPAFVGVGILWGLLYAEWGERLDVDHDSLRGAVFAILPLLVSLGVVMPVLGWGFFGVSGSGPVAAVGESLRHLVYGVVLGASFPIFLYRRRVRVLPHDPTEMGAQTAS